MQVLVVEKMQVLSEYYFALVMDRAFKVSWWRVHPLSLSPLSPSALWLYYIYSIAGLNVPTKLQA